MKLNTSSEAVEVHGGSTRSSFSIAMNGKAFRVLSDTLYQNKIGSIVREISCNAYDAHVAANKKDIPFVIHLPDAFEPWFSVQDFGDGMSPDDIGTVFTVYFQSTKDMSNDAIGAFGIGAKTPFSYTDQFTVVSVNNGERRVYSAFIDETDIPNIIEMSCSKDDGASGIEIKMSVKPDDYRKFATETQSQLKFFNVKPTIVNASHFSFSDTFSETIFKNDKVTIQRSKEYNSSGGLYAVHGIVGYPIDHSKHDKFSEENQKLIRYFNNHAGYVSGALQFPIGDIDVTSSRENLQYTERTISVIDSALTVIRDDLKKYVTSVLDTLETVWDKAVFLSEFKDIAALAPDIGISLNEHLVVDRGGKYSFQGLYQQDLAADGVKIKMQRFWLNSRGVLVSGTTNFIPCLRSTVIAVCDTRLKYKIRAQQLLEAGDDGVSVTFIHYESTVPGVTARQVADKMKVLLGGYKGIGLVSEIVVPKRKIVRSGTLPVRDGYHVYYRSGASVRRKWIKQTGNIDTETAYIVSDKITTAFLDNMGLIQKFNSLDPDIPLVCIRKSNVESAKQNSNLVPASEWVEKQLNEIKNNTKAYHDWKKHTIESFIVSIVPRQLLDDGLFAHLSRAAATSPATRMLRICRRFTGRMSNEYKLGELNAMAATVGWSGNDIISSEQRSKLSDCVDAIFERYPLLRLYGSGYSPNVRRMISTEHLAKYVSAM